MSSFHDSWLNPVGDSVDKSHVKLRGRRFNSKWPDSFPSDEVQIKENECLMDQFRSSELTDSDSNETIYITASDSGKTLDGKAVKLSELPDINVYHHLRAETSNKSLLDMEESENRFPKTTFVCHDVEGTSELELVQLGIKLSVQDVSHTDDLNVLMTDFIVTKMITNPKFRKVNFKFIAYAPIAFRFFRETFGIDTEHFMRSMCDEPFMKIPSFSKKSIKTYMTMDGQFLLKTCSKEDAEFLKFLFPAYFLNFTQHPESLLPKYFGLFSYTKGTKKVLLLITNNLLPNYVYYQDMYYLKGSTYSKRRTGNKDGKCESYFACSNTSLKDLDFLENCPDGYYLPEETYERLMKSVSSDCQMLASYRIINYCLVLGVCTPSLSSKARNWFDSQDINDACQAQLTCAADDTKHEDSKTPFVAFTSKGEPVHLYLGFANILQSYNFKRKFEYLSKSVVYKSSAVSINRPEIYALRLQNFLKNYVLKIMP